MIKSLLRRADLLQPRVEEDAKMRTNRGGALFLAACVVTLALAYRSFSAFLSPGGEVAFSERMEVDGEMSAKLPLDLKVTFFHIACLDIELVALDVAGEAQIDIRSQTLHKTRIDSQGALLGETMAGLVNRKEMREKALSKLSKEEKECGSCYGAEERPNDCCNTCQEVKARYQRRGWDSSQIQREAYQCLSELDHPEVAVEPGEGCILEGTIFLNKVAGNVHVALGSTQRMGDQVIHTFSQEQMLAFDTSHYIERLRFGQPIAAAPSGGANTQLVTATGVLDGTTRLVDKGLGKTAAIQYHLHLVPTRTMQTFTSYRYTMTERYFPVLEPDQEAATSDKSSPLLARPPKPEEQQQQHGPKKGARQFTLPGVYFMYDFSPFVVVREPIVISPVDLLVDMLTLAGGVFALVRLTDWMLCC